MARFFFHVHDGEEILDLTGTEFVGPEAARAAAVRASGEMLRDLDGGFWVDPDWRMRVVDEGGEEVCSLRFAAEVPSKG